MQSSTLTCALDVKCTCDALLMGGLPYKTADGRALVCRVCDMRTDCSTLSSGGAMPMTVVWHCLAPESWGCGFRYHTP